MPASSSLRQAPLRALAVVVSLVMLAPALGVAAARPAGAEVDDPLAGLDPLVLAMLAEDAHALMGAAFHPAWTSSDPDALATFLRAHYDAETDAFAFRGPTAANDTMLAESVMEQVRFMQALSEAHNADLRALVEALFTTGAAPEGWEEVTPGAEGAPADAPDAEAPPEGYREDAPRPAWLDAGGAGPDGTGEGTQHFFIDSCPKCDQYLFRASSPIVATFDIGTLDPTKITEAALDVSAFDVDWGSSGCPGGPERDAVSLNGNFAGYLTGADSSWSSSGYNLNPAWFVAGVNTLAVDIDATGTGCWAVEVDFFDVTVNRFTGPVVITDHTTSKEAYNLADKVPVTTTIKTSEEGPYPARVEWNLVQPDGNIVQTLSKSATLAKDAPQALTHELTVPTSGKEGTWTVVAIAYDKDGAKSDEASKPIAVGVDLAVTTTDIKIKIVDSNKNSGLLKIEATIGWNVNTKIAGPQAYDMEIAVVTGGTRAPVEKIARSDAAGAQTLTRTLEVKAGAKLQVVLDTGNAIKESKEDNNKAEKSLCNPKVKEAVPKVKGKYLSRVKFENDWTATVEEAGDDCPDIVKVVYDFDGSKVESDKKGESWKATFDMGKISAGFNRPLKVYAVDADGNQGDAWETTLWMRSLPEFVVWGLSGGGATQGFSASISVQGDEAIFKFSFNRTFLRKETSISDKVPVIGGKWGGKVDFTVEAEVTTKGDTFKLTGSIGGDFKAGDKAGLALKGSLAGTFKNPPGDVGWHLSKLTVSGSVTWTSPPIPIPQLSVPKLVETTVKFKVGLALKFGFNENGSWDIFGLKMDQFDFSVTVGITASMKLSLDKLVSLSASGGGSVTPHAAFPPPDLLKQVDVSLTFSVKGSFMGWEKTFFEYKWSNSYLFALAEPTPFELPARAWMTEGYAEFVAEGADGQVVRKMYPYANPETAGNALGHLMTVYTQDAQGRPRPQSYDPHFTFFDGEGWSAPAAISATDHPDFDPAVALDDAGQALAVWMRFEDTTLPESAILPQMAHLVDLHYAHWTEASGWSAPAPLVDTGIVELKPTVAADGEGGFLVAYVSSSDNVVLTPSQLDIPADESAPVLFPTRDLHLTRVAAGVPPTPAVTLATGVAMVGAPRVVPLGPGAFLYVYAADADGNARTAHDVTLYAVPGTLALGLGQPVVLATGFVKDPAVAVSAGNPVVAWVDQAEGAAGQRVASREVLTALGGLAPSEEVTLVAANPNHPVMNDLTLRIDPVTFDRVLTWTGQSVDGEGQQVFYATAPASGVPDAGADETEPRAAAALTPPDEVAWRASAFVTAAPDGTRTLRVVSLNVDAAGDSNLASASRALLPDAVVESVATSVPNPAQGATVDVVVVVRNAGDEDVQALALELTDNGSSVGTAIVGPIARGASVAHTFAWTVPEDDAAHALAARADPLDALREASEENNVATLVTVLPDVAVTFLAETGVGGEFAVTARVANVGARTAPAGVATLALDDAEGALLSVAYPALAPGATVQLDATPDLALVPVAGAFVTLRVAAPEDADRANDAEDAHVRAAPDLVLSALDVPPASAGPAVAGSVLVANAGARAAPATTLTVHASDLAAPALASANVPALAPGASARVAFAFPAAAGERLYYVRAGDDAFAEEDPASNVLGQRLTFAGRADLDVSEASLAFAANGDVRVTVFNRGDGDAPFATFNLYNGPPATAPKYGPKYVTEVKTLVGRGSIANVPAGGHATTVIPASALDLAQIPASGRLSVWLDPENVTDDANRANHVGATPMFSARSTTHPDPFVAKPATTAAFEFGRKPGLAYGGASYVLDRFPGTVPDTTAETTGTSTSFAGLAQGEWFLHARGLVGGQWSETVHLRFRVNANDLTAPVTTLVVDSPWVEEGGVTYLGDNVPLTLVARDLPTGGEGVSGVALTRVAVDGAWRDYTGPFRLMTAGAQLVQWQSRDAAGNWEAVRERAFFVELDVHAPETTLAGATDVAGALYARPGTPLAFDARDPEPYFARFAAGVASTSYRVDGGAWTAYAGAFALGGADGARLVEFASVDRAGNAEATRAVTVVVDATAPVASVASHDDGELVAGVVTFVLDAADALSGMARVDLYHEGALVATAEGGNGAFNLTVDTGFWPFGTTHLAFEAFDALGNRRAVPLDVYVLSRHVGVYKDPFENLDRYLPGAIRGSLPV